MPGTRESFGPERRIKRRGDFLRIQSEGLKLRSPHFVLAVSRAPVGRLGITITTKIDKRASRRNALRRRIREVYRRRSSVPQADAVVIALSGAVQLTFEEMEGELEPLFRKAEKIIASRP